MSNPLSEKFRTTAADLRKAAEAVVVPPELINLKASIIGHIQANTLEALATTVEYLKGTEATDPISKARKDAIERSKLIREAAAKASVTGDWNEFDRIVAANGGVPADPAQPS